VGGISLASLPGNAYHTIHGSFWGGGYGVSSWTNIDPNWLYQNENYFRSLYGYTGPQAFVPTFSFDTREKANAGYMKLNYGFTALGFPVDGNVGFRYVDTTLLEDAYTQTYVPANPAVGPTVGANANCTTCVQYTPTSASKEDYQFLPSINVRVTLDDGLFMRIGASKTVTRPTFAQLNPGQTLSAPTATLLTGTASSGNAALSPEKSTNVDWDLEYYWGNGNHVSGALFNRDVTGYIQNVATPISIAGVPYTLTAPANIQNASIKGAELGYSQFLDFLPDFWSGFGWDLNGTYVDGAFNNISKWGLNASGIYEKGPYSVRVSYTWRSSSQVNTTFSPGVQSNLTIASPRENLDASFNYTVNDNLILTLDGTNLAGSVFRDHAGRGAQNELYYSQELESFDRTYSIGLRYKM
jgi:TonB-dependent receptor